MATATRKKPAKKAGAKKGGAKKGGSTRASNAELDKLAEKVVELRDNQELSWGEIEAKLEVAPSRLRQLYNRGGGKPTRERKGAAKASENGKGKTTAKKKGKGKKRPS